MLSSGKETDIESAEKAGRLRYDDLACGKFAVGRHAQVLFDGGMWYVGVVAKLHVDMHAEPTAAIMLFEDGDRVQVPLPDASIELLPRDWSEFVEKKRKWGWWGFNKDRVQVALSKEGGEAEGVAADQTPAKYKARQVAKKGVGRGGEGAVKPQEQTVAHAAKQEQQKAPAACGKRGAAAKESMEGQHPAQAADAEGAGVRETKTKRARGNTSKQSGSADASSSAGAEQALSEEMARLTEQMRGTESGLYLGCPVQVKLAEESWAKGLVVAPAAGTSPGCVHVRLEDGQIVQPSAKPESGEVRFDAESAGDAAVGRHVQLLFEGGMWYIGVVAQVKIDAVGCVTQLRTLFEDGEDTWVDWPDPSGGTILMTKEWSTNVSKDRGWWGFNADRVKHIQKKLREERKEAEGLDAARGRQTGKSLALNVNIPEASDPADPDIPRGTGRLSARGKSRDYSKLVSGAGLGPLPGEEDSTSNRRKKPATKAPATPAAKAAAATPRGGGGGGRAGSNLSSLAIALSLCDSLRDAAYQLIANPGNSLSDFGSHMRFFESRLCRSALVDSYTQQVRQSLLGELSSLKDEKVFDIHAMHIS